MPIQDRLERYRHPGPERLKLYAGLYAMLVGTAVLGRARKDDLGTLGTLRRSQFARVMFMDIGAVSTLAAVYVVLTGTSKLRYPAAVASLFAGSFALIPYLAYEDWRAMQKKVDRGS